MNTEIEDLKEWIAVRRQIIAELEQEARSKERELQKLESQEFIRVNKITRKDVQFCDGDGVPYFGMASNFADWLRKTESSKPWASWNGTIHHTGDLIAGKFLATPGLVEDLPE